MSRNVKNLTITRNIYAIATTLTPISGFLLVSMPQDIAEYISNHCPIIESLPPILKDSAILAGTTTAMVFGAYCTYKTNRELKIAKKKEKIYCKS
ncbi:MAG: hypothetical protein HFJ12_04975 [Bacilli bacterium]|nr:hypothetical protein [Bacilli bacterium]